MSLSPGSRLAIRDGQTHVLEKVSDRQVHNTQRGGTCACPQFQTLLPCSWKLHVTGHDRAPVPMPQIASSTCTVLLPELGRGVIFSPPGTLGSAAPPCRVASHRYALPLRRRQVMRPCRTGTDRVGLQSAHHGAGSRVQLVRPACVIQQARRAGAG
jgi:hypothetical protein